MAPTNGPLNDRRISVKVIQPSHEVCRPGNVVIARKSDSNPVRELVTESQSKNNRNIGNCRGRSGEGCRREVDWDHFCSSLENAPWITYVLRVAAIGRK